MKEELTLTQILAEEKSTMIQIHNLVHSDGFCFVTYYLKNSPYVGPRSNEEQTKYQKATMQSFFDLMTRLKALKRAHTRANHTTMVTVPCEPDFQTLLNGGEVGTEEISIAEAINRKNFYKGRSKATIANDNFPMAVLAQLLLQKYTKNCKERSIYEEKAKNEVRAQMERKFPSDSKQSWSQDKYNEERAKEEANVEVIRIDPLDFIGTDAISKFYNAIQDYIVRIDSIISEANATTRVVVEY
jgi:hypothetical protein